MGWLIYAFVSAGAAALTAILAKVGVEGVPSNLATAIRTVIIGAFAWTDPASRVSPIDKLRLPLTSILAAVFLGESVGWRLAIGVALMTAGAILTITA